MKKGQHHSKKWRKEQSIRLKKMWEDPDYRAMQSKSHIDGMTNEIRERLRQQGLAQKGHRGHKWTDEEIERERAKKIIWYETPEGITVKKKISKKLKGNKPWNTGLPHEKQPRYGMTTIHSEKTKAKIRAKRFNQIFPLKDTSIELIVQKYLNDKGFIFDKHLNIENISQPDIIIGKRLIFVDGCYWHGCPECPIKISEQIKLRRKKDLDVDSVLKSLGYKVIRIWEHDIKNGKYVKMIEEFLE